MRIGEFLFSSAWLWTCLASLFLAMGAAALTRLPSRSRYPERARRRKGVWAPLAAAAAVVALTVGLFAHGVPGFFSPELGVFAGIAFIVFFVAWRFRRAVGIPVLILLSTAIAFAYLVFAPWMPVRPGEVVATVRVLGVDPAIHVEIIIADEPVPEERGRSVGVAGESRFVSIEEPSLSVAYEELRFSGHWFFAGRGRGLRPVGIVGAIDSAFLGAAGAGRQTVAASSPIDAVHELIRGDQIPGVTRRVVTTTAVVPRLLRRYAVVTAPHGIELVEFY